MNEPNVSQVLLIDNSPEGTPAKDLANTHYYDNYSLEEKVEYIRSPGKTIYWAWNEGIRRGAETGQNVAILNDDIILPVGSLVAAEYPVWSAGWMLMGLNYFEPNRAVNQYERPRQVYGTFRTTGFGGFAFIVSSTCPQVDSRFQWWYGDDDLAERIKAVGGRMGLAPGAPVDHPCASTTGNQHPWTQVAAGEDTILFRELWPDAP